MRTRVAIALVLFALVLAPAACRAAGAAAPQPSTETAVTPTSTGVVTTVVSVATTAASEASAGTTAGAFALSSPAVSDGTLIPEYKCEAKVNGVEESIPLSWANVPASAKSLAVIMYHYPDPNDKTRVSSYLLLWGIDPSVTEIPHGKADDGPWFMGANKDGVAISYTSPCSRGTGTHEYIITLYALSETPSSLPRESSVSVTYEVLKEALETVNVIDTASLTFVNATP